MYLVEKHIFIYVLHFIDMHSLYGYRDIHKSYAGLGQGLSSKVRSEPPRASLPIYPSQDIGVL